MKRGEQKPLESRMNKRRGIHSRQLLPNTGAANPQLETAQ